MLSRLLATAALLFGVAPATAFAEAGDAARKSETPPYRLVRVIPETNQALLFDRDRATHVLVDAGNTIGGYDVIQIDADQVVLAKDGENREYVLVAGDTAAPSSRIVDPYPALPAAAPTFTAAMLLDPYADVLDPYAAPDPAPAPVEVEPPKPAPPRELDLEVSRAQLDAELGDFDAIAETVEMTVVDAGVELTEVAEGSFFHRMGLRTGDVVLSVDGTAIRGLDEAATVYTRLLKAPAFVVEVTRAGAPLTLRYEVTIR